MKIEQIHTRIANCHICPKMDKYKKIRNPISVSKKTTVFILSQSLAENQLRKSGVNFFKPDGKLGSTGNQLEKFLNRINQTVFPPTDIQLEDGIIIPKKSSKYNSVYNTELIQCYPGKSKIKGDRLPENEEIINCLSQGFLFSEIGLIKPKLLLLMGNTSIKTFYKHILKIANKTPVTKLINEIVQSNSVPTVNFSGINIGFLPIHHASGLNPHYNKMVNNEDFIKLINNYLDHESN